MKEHTNVRIDSELLKLLRDAAKKERRSFTNYIEVVLWDHVNSESQKEPAKKLIKMGR
jgi:predicted HicB family RNase H-like nuclease